MSIRDTMNKAKQYERAFNLIRWGEGLPQNQATRGWPKDVSETNSGKFNVNLVADFLFDQVRIFTFDNDDGTTTTKLSFSLMVADPNHVAVNDLANFSVYMLTLDELNDENLTFPRSKTREFLQNTLALMFNLGILDEDPLKGEWEDAIPKLLMNFEKLSGKYVKAGVFGQMYTPKNDPTLLKGPYLDVKWFNHETDGTYETEPEEMPF